jgi:7,8-dihydropterin-6-yl-methyl-4-(beta-D-ribofuranosyl)aminobenzene 5'-phosphate synthase
MPNSELGGTIKIKFSALFITNRKYKMRKSFGLTGLILLLGLATIFAGEPAVDSHGSPDSVVHITIIYDNYQADPNLQTGWGFACLVGYQGNQLLFDAGGKVELYKKNIRLLNIKPEEIPTLFISHEHGDHTAGIPWITEVNPTVKCYFPASYFEQLKASGQLPPNSKRVNKSMRLYGPFYSTGDDFAAFREQGLVINTENGGVLITGCGHPGIIRMVAVSKEELGIEIHTVIGGLHLMDKSEEELKQIAATLKGMGVRQICPTHCTGDNAIESFKSSFGDGYMAGGTGKEIIIQ